MKLRHHESGTLATASTFNMCSLCEIVVYFNDGEADSDYLSHYDVLLETGPRAGQWVRLTDAFDQHDVIIDNLNSCFFEPKTDADRERGYTL